MIKNGWFNADGNYFKIEENEKAVLLRVYQKASDETKTWISKKTYRLRPELLKMEIEEGKLNMDYNDFYVEPVHEGEAHNEFERVADMEYEAGVEAAPAATNHLVAAEAWHYVEAEDFF